MNWFSVQMIFKGISDILLHWFFHYHNIKTTLIMCFEKYAIRALDLQTRNAFKNITYTCIVYNHGTAQAFYYLGTL